MNNFDQILTESLQEQFGDKLGEFIEPQPITETVQEVVAEPVASVNPANVVEQAPQATEAQPQIDEQLRVQIEQELRTKLEEEFNSKPRQELKFANESIKKLNELAEAGIDVNSENFWKWQVTDIEKFDTNRVDDALELKRLELEIEKPELNPQQIQRLLKRSYPVLFDSSYTAEDKEYQEALEDLSIDAIGSVTKLKQHKEKVTLPKVSLQEKEQMEAQSRAAREAFILDVRKNVQSYTEEPIKLKEDLEIKYAPSVETKKFVESSIVNNETFFTDNYVKDGSVDFSRLRRDMTRIHDFDNIIKTVFEQGVSSGRSEVADVIENASEDVRSQKQQVAKSYEDQIREQYLLQNSRKKG